MRSVPWASVTTAPMPHSPGRSKFSCAVKTPRGVTGQVRNTASRVSMGPCCSPVGVRKNVDTLTSASRTGPVSASMTPNTTRLLPTARSLEARARRRDSGVAAGGGMAAGCVDAGAAQASIMPKSSKANSISAMNRATLSHFRRLWCQAEMRSCAAASSRGPAVQGCYPGAGTRKRRCGRSPYTRSSH